jgi:hypothetical protein
MRPLPHLLPLPPVEHVEVLGEALDVSPREQVLLVVAIAALADRLPLRASPRRNERREVVVGGEVHVPEIEHRVVELPAIHDPGHGVGHHLLRDSVPLLEGLAQKAKGRRLPGVLRREERRSPRPARDDVEELDADPALELVGGPVELAPLTGRGDHFRGRRPGGHDLEAELLEPLAHDRVAAGEAAVDELLVATHGGELPLALLEPGAHPVLVLVELAPPRDRDVDLTVEGALAVGPAFVDLQEERLHRAPADAEGGCDLALGTIQAGKPCDLVGQRSPSIIPHS